MYKRRELFPMASGLVGAAALLSGTEAEAATREVKFDPYKMSPQMRDKYAIKMPTLDRQAAEDFYGSFRLAMASQYGSLEDDIHNTLEERGIKVDPNCSLQEAWDHCLKDSRFAMKARTWMSGQQLMWGPSAILSTARPKPFWPRWRRPITPARENWS
jgi:hypothetical protein